MKQFVSVSKRYESDVEREDRRVAMVCTILANSNRDRKRRSKPFTIDDFMPKPVGPARKRQTPEQQMAILSLAAAGGPNGLLRKRG